MCCDCFINALLTKDWGEVEGHLKKKTEKKRFIISHLDRTNLINKDLVYNKNSY